MADEITIDLSVRASNGDGVDESWRKNFKSDMTGTHIGIWTQDIGFAGHEVLAFPTDLGTAGYALLTNPDAANYVQIGGVSGSIFVPVMRLLAGESQVVRFDNSDIYAKAGGTTAVALVIRVLEA